uniref:RNA polymerase sigma-70 region 2 domain-containing protein n=1 Tax=Chondromyces catenulatus TaxID=1653841 RepID=A0A3S5GY05_9BACT|nr:hypothetical protein [Chondromyces catenulatus]
MSMSMPTVQPKREGPLADPALHRALLDFVRRRVPHAEADDIVQVVLCEALTAKALPEDATELRKYLLGIAKHKVVDALRRAVREEVCDPPELTVAPAPVEEASLLRWAERQAPATEEAKRTLAWMAREGEGEKLESIAADEKVPAARVRQRVSRMRRWMKERWLAELAAVAALAVLAFVLYRVLSRAPQPEVIRPDDVPAPAPLEPPLESPLDKARALRTDALRRCEAQDFRGCIERLDDAAKLDPAGEIEPAVRDARERARRALDDDAVRSPPEETKAAPKSRAPAPYMKNAAPIDGKPRSKIEPKNADVGEEKLGEAVSKRKKPKAMPPRLKDGLPAPPSKE